MQALRGSAFSSPALKFFPEKYCGDEGLFNKRKEPLFLRPPSFPRKHVNHLSFSVSKPVHKKRPIFSFSPLSSSDTTEMQLDDIQDEETEDYDMISQSKTVRVRFQLQRECSFGHQFHIVGDDPMLGQWDPSGAVPFNWSEGHVWTTELDVPIGKCIKYKIIQKEGPENIIWQPGPDRILQTWETENTITICEDWDIADCQKIIEQEPTSDQIEESIINAQEDITDSNNEVHIDESNTIHGRGLVSNVKESPVALSDEDINMLMLGGDGSIMNTKDSKLTTNETLSTKELPLLVPGLDPLPTTQPKEEVLKEVETSIFGDVSIEADNCKELNMPELKLEQVLDNDYKEQHQHAQIENPQYAEDEDQQNPKSYDLVLGNDNRWGLSTLQKLFANFLFE